MTYQEYINEVKHAQRIKKAIRACMAAAALVAVLGGLGYASGYNRGHLAGLHQGADAVAACTEEGASGWIISAEGAQCLYD